MELNKTDLSKLLCNYVFADYECRTTQKGTKKYLDHIANIINKNVECLFDIDGEETLDKNINEYFPFLSLFPKDYNIDDNLIDKTILLCSEVNAYIKEKQFTPKEGRIFYDIKKQIILNLHIFSDRIIDEWSERRETDGEIFVSYKIRLSNGNTVTFHQPFRNVSDILYKRAAKKNAILENRREYHHETDYTFSLIEDEKKEMHKKMNILSILNLVTKRYFMKQVQEKKPKTI